MVSENYRADIDMSLESCTCIYYLGMVFFVFPLRVVVEIINSFLAPARLEFFGGLRKVQMIQINAVKFSSFTMMPFISHA